MRDSQRGAEDVEQARAALRRLDPDIVALFDIDHDLDSLALDAIAGDLFPHRFSRPPNSGVPSGLDLDADGRLGGPGDAWGWGRFRGAGGMAVVSRHPIDLAAVRDWSSMPWDALPDARVPLRDGQVFPSAEARARQRLASVAIWDVPVHWADRTITLHLSHAAPPAFDGPEARNRLRNADEIAFWRHRLDGRLAPGLGHPFVILCICNADPERGDANRAEISALITHRALQDPRPQGHHPATGAPDTATGHWPDGTGALRTDYILPSRALQVLDSGILWPSPEASHGIVWLDLALSDG